MRRAVNVANAIVGAITMIIFYVFIVMIIRYQLPFQARECSCVCAYVYRIHKTAAGALWETSQRKYKLGKFMKIIFIYVYLIYMQTNWKMISLKFTNFLINSFWNVKCGRTLLLLLCVNARLCLNFFLYKKKEKYSCQMLISSFTDVWFCFQSLSLSFNVVRTLYTKKRDCNIELPA